MKKWYLSIFILLSIFLNCPAKAQNVLNYTKDDAKVYIALKYPYYLINKETDTLMCYVSKDYDYFYLLFDRNTHKCYTVDFYKKMDQLNQTIKWMNEMFVPLFEGHWKDFTTNIIYSIYTSSEGDDTFALVLKYDSKNIYKMGEPIK